MSKSIYTTITGTGKYVPTTRIPNEAFLSNEFYEKNGEKVPKTNQEIIDKFLEITTIAERRYVTDEHTTSDIAFLAAQEAILSAGIEKEELDYIIVAHNFGDVKPDVPSLDIVPSLAARVKHMLKIKNHNTIAYDLPFGCPGWLQGVIQADYYIKSGDAKKILVIGADILSRIADPHDRDTMLYADGAGAVVLEAKSSEKPIGIIAHRTRSDTFLYSEMLYMGESYKVDESTANKLYLKMNGRRLYQYALETVPQTVKECLEKADIDILDVDKVLLHQANGKMDDAILARLFKLYGIKDIPEGVMPMTISWLGNTSVATLPTLLDIIMKGELKPQSIEEGNTVVFASVGAGMNINAVVYKM